MKKWQLIYPGKSPDPQGEITITPGQGLEGLIVAVKWSKLAREAKKLEIVSTASKVVETSHKQGVPAGIWIDIDAERLSDSETEALASIESDITIERVSSIPGAQRSPFNDKTYAVMTSEILSRDFESLFYSLSQQEYMGIAFDIEAVTKGHIALAHKFNLDTIVYGIRFERHSERADLLHADQYIIG